MFSAASSASSTASVTLKLGVEFVSAYYSALVNDTANLYTFYEVSNRGEGKREDGQGNAQPASLSPHQPPPPCRPVVLHCIHTHTHAISPCTLFDASASPPPP